MHFNEHMSKKEDQDMRKKRNLLSGECVTSTDIDYYRNPIIVIHREIRFHRDWHH